MLIRDETGQHVSIGEPTDEERAAYEWYNQSPPEPSVEQETQARIDYADDREFGDRLFGQTLEAEERMQAREWEIERTRTRMDRSQRSDREARCREDVRSRMERLHVEFAERRGSVDRWADPREADAREQLPSEVLARVNRAARRISEKFPGFTPAAVSRLVAERAVETGDVESAVLATYEALEVDPGSVVPIGRLGDVKGSEVSVQGRVVTLWQPTHTSIAQVGLLEDESGRTKFTSWKKSGQPTVEEGETVRIREAAKSWYDGRCSIALTGRSRLEVVGSAEGDRPSGGPCIGAAPQT